ncbi:MAG: MarR family transcriptional regulator [Bacteroidales bacterium]
MEASKLVLKTLGESKVAMKAGEIAEKSGLDRKEVDKAMKILKADGSIVSPKVCYWTKA